MDLPFKGHACWQIINNVKKINESSVHDTQFIDSDHFNGLTNELSDRLSIEDYIKATLIIIITIFIITLNVLMMIVLHSKHHSRYLRELPKILMTSLACTDLAVGCLVTPISFITLIHKCWPWGQTFCAIQALLLAALFHESTLSLVLIAIDRYICIIHPLQYHSLMTKKVCYVMVFLTWIISFSVYSILIYPKSEYHYDSIGVMNCEPFYPQKYIIVAVTLLFYIPPAIIMIYCYSTILKVAQKQIQTIQNSPPSIYSTIQGCESIRKLQVKEKKKTYRTLVTLGSMSAGFIIAITPWTLTELVSSIWEFNLPNNVVFIATWISISNSFWNPILYGLLNKSFRRVAIEIVHRYCCRSFLFRILITSMTSNHVNNNDVHNQDEDDDDDFEVQQHELSNDHFSLRHQLQHQLQHQHEHDHVFLSEH